MEILRLYSSLKVTLPTIHEYDSRWRAFPWCLSTCKRIKVRDRRTLMCELCTSNKCGGYAIKSCIMQQWTSFCLYGGSVLPNRPYFETDMDIKIYICLFCLPNSNTNTISSRKIYEWLRSVTVIRWRLESMQFVLLLLFIWSLSHFGSTHE